MIIEIFQKDSMNLDTKTTFPILIFSFKVNLFIDNMRSPDFIEFDTLHYSYSDMFAKHFLAQVIIKFQYDIECLKLLDTLFRNLILSFFTHSKCLVKHTAKRTQFLLQISTCFLYTSQFFLYLRQPFFKRAGKRRF